MKNLLLTWIIFLFIACAKEPITTEQKGEFKVEFLFEKNGCKVYRFLDSGRYIYWSDCTGNIEYNYSTHSGKNTTNNTTQSITN